MGESWGQVRAGWGHSENWRGDGDWLDAPVPQGSVYFAFRLALGGAASAWFCQKTIRPLRNDKRLKKQQDARGR